jgi:hypothetical protein
MIERVDWERNPFHSLFSPARREIWNEIRSPISRSWLSILILCF